jgi:hypothetical protein
MRRLAVPLLELRRVHAKSGQDPHGRDIPDALILVYDLVPPSGRGRIY